MGFCDQGHPEHDAANGCGPCMDEMLAGLGARDFAYPADVRAMLAGRR